MSGFSIDWLDLREAADHRARDGALLRRARDWLAARPVSRQLILDMGCGTGSTIRAFAGLGEHGMPATTRWQLFDHDGDLLREAQARHGGDYHLQTVQGDLTDISALPLEGVSLISASALFDLASAQFIDQLVDRLTERARVEPIALYAALNYDGKTQWSPDHPSDAAVLAAFNEDQQRIKSFGPALGPEAASYLQHKLSEAGFKVFNAESPWVLADKDRTLTAALIDGIADAVAQDHGIEDAQITDWRQFRHRCLGGGASKAPDAAPVAACCTVGHIDVLAVSAP